MKIFLYLMTVVLIYLDFTFARTSFRSQCPTPNFQINNTVTYTECLNDEQCKAQGQICCQEGVKNVCQNPVYYKALCPEDDILLNNGEWTKFCMGDCNCPDNMACCPGPCTAKICRISNNKRVDCPPPETYNCISNENEIKRCLAHKDCINNDHLCCPDACNNRYCQIPSFHHKKNKDDEEFHDVSVIPEISPKISPQIESNTEAPIKIFPQNETETEVTSNEEITCDPFSSCFDISLTLGGESLEKYFPLWTVFINNSVDKCAALCQLWGYTKIAISTEIGCFCFNGDLDRLTCKTNESCSFPCPGDNKYRCGGLFPIYVNIYKTDFISNTDAKAVFPSGMCYKANVTKNGELIADVLPKIANLTPKACKVECMHRGFPMSCTYTGNVCGCYKAANKPNELSPFQEYCNAKCTGDVMGVPNGITCGGQPSPALPVVNCLPTF